MRSAQQRSQLRAKRFSARRLRARRFRAIFKNGYFFVIFLFITLNMNSAKVNITSRINRAPITYKKQQQKDNLL